MTNVLPLRQLFNYHRRCHQAAHEKFSRTQPESFVPKQQEEEREKKVQDDTPICFHAFMIQANNPINSNSDFPLRC